MTSAIAVSPQLLDRLFRCRLIIARFGEMDMLGWWNTKGLLGRMGSTVMSRGFPHIHRFAQARTVFAVARARCREVYSLQDAVTLWDLPAEVEDAFEERWQHWIHETTAVVEIFQGVESLTKTDAIPAALEHLGEVPVTIFERTAGLRRGPDGRSVPITGISGIDDTAVGILAAAFARGEAGQLAVPAARRGTV